MIQTKNFSALSGKSIILSALLEGEAAPIEIETDQIATVETVGLYEYQLPDVAGKYELNAFESGVWVGNGFEFVLPEPRGKIVSGNQSYIITDLDDSVDDAFNGQVVRFYSGANKGKNRTVGNYVGATKRIEFIVPLPYAVSANDRFEIIGYID